MGKQGRIQLQVRTKSIWTIIVLSVLAVLALVACAPASPMPAEPTNQEPQSSPPTPTQPVEVSVEEKARASIDLAKADLAQRQQVSEDKIFLQSVEEVQFADASLGVPEPGKMYAQVVTPGYVIRLIVGGQAFKYHASGDRAVLADGQRPSATATPADKVMVTLFFGNQAAGAAGDCNMVYPAMREIAATSDLLRAVLELLFAGPTEEEKAQGFTSVFSQATKDILKGVRVEGNTAYVDLEDIRFLIPSVSASCGGAAFFASVKTTLVQVVPVERVLYAINENPALFYEWVQMGCYEGNDNCDPTPFQQMPGGANPDPVTVIGDPLLALPDSATVISRVSTDLNADGAPEEVFLVGRGGAPDRLGYDSVSLLVLTPSADGRYAVTWQSEQLMGERGEALQVQDINGDGLPEVLSTQSMGASGVTMYVLAWMGDQCGLLLPRGGYFDSWASFGEKGVRMEDLDGDGVVEILGGYGPAASQTDVYRWDGEAYGYLKTLAEGG